MTVKELTRSDTPNIPPAARVALSTRILIGVALVVVGGDGTVNGHINQNKLNTLKQKIF